jgi:hypothetical protein
VNNIGKHSSLVRCGYSYCRKKFYSTHPEGAKRELGIEQMKQVFQELSNFRHFQKNIPAILKD